MTTEILRNMLLRGSEVITVIIPLHPGIEQADFKHITHEHK